MSKKIITVVIGLLMLTAFSSSAQKKIVPIDLQAALFKKIFEFNRTLKAKETIVIGVYSDRGSADEIIDAFSNVGIDGIVILGNKIPKYVNVVYVMQGTLPPKAQCVERGILSITGDASEVEKGNISIGVGVEDHKPKILINMAQLKAERQEISDYLLKISEIFQ